MRILPFVMVAALLSGCATLSEKECTTVDWRELGWRDGSAGHPRSRLADHGEACAKVRVVPDRAGWQAGYEEGLKQYCRPEHGLELGVEGRHYGHVCPPDLESGFLANYRAGREVYDQRQILESLESDRRTLEDKLSKADKDEDRRRIRDDLRSIDARLRRERDILYRKEASLRRRTGQF